MSDARALIQNVLRPGERILWTGEPRPWRLATPLFFLLAFLVVWAVLPGLLASLAREAAEPPAKVPASITVVFFAFGAGLALPTLRSIRAAWRTHYAVTNQRAIILVDVWPRGVWSFGPDAVARMQRTGGEDLGVLAFGPPDRPPSGIQQGGLLVARRAFVGVPEPRRVEALIRQHILSQPSAESRPA